MKSTKVIAAIAIVGLLTVISNVKAQQESRAAYEAKQQQEQAKPCGQGTKCFSRKAFLIRRGIAF